MKISVNQENMNKALSIVGRAVSLRSTMPILSNVLLEAKGEQLRLSATDRGIGISCWIGANIEEEGAITIPSRLLMEFVSSLPSARIDMNLVDLTQTLHLSCARHTANMKGIAADEFPIIPTIGEIQKDDLRLELEIASLRKMIDQVVYAAGTDVSRPTLSGVEVKFADHQFSMVALDGFRLSLRRVNMLQSISNDTAVIVPGRSFSELSRISADADDNHPAQVTLTKTHNQIIFQLQGKGEETRGAFNRIELVSELIDARFPDYNGIIPKSYETRAIVDTEALLKAVRVAQIFARDNANIIYFNIHPGNGDHNGQIRLTAVSAEMGDNVTCIDATIEGKEIDIAFNAKYFIDSLTQVDQSQVILEMTQPTRPGTLRPVGMSEDDYLCTFMPMRYQKGETN